MGVMVTTMKITLKMLSMLELLPILIYVRSGATCNMSTGGVACIVSISGRPGL